MKELSALATTTAAVVAVLGWKALLVMAFLGLVFVVGREYFQPFLQRPDRRHARSDSYRRERHTERT